MNTCVSPHLIFLFVFLLHGCVINNFTSTNPPPLVRRPSVSLLPKGSEQRILSAKSQFSRILDISEFGYARRSNFQILGMTLTLEVKKDVELFPAGFNEATIHTCYFLTLPIGESDWRKSKLYQLRQYIDVPEPPFFMLFSLPQDELFLWLYEDPIIIPDGYDPEEWLFRQNYPGSLPPSFLCF